MNENTKIALSAKELELVCNTEWILTKQIIIEKVYNLFGSAAAAMQQKLRATNLSTGMLTTPKISRGENYQQLPYVILDYPRLFGKADAAAIRTFFWWGNFCSVNLHLAGSYKIATEQKLVNAYKFLVLNNYFICIGNTPWQHHFETDNFTPAAAFSFDEFALFIRQKTFIKIAKKIPLSEWENMHSFILKSFEELAQFL